MKNFNRVRGGRQAKLNGHRFEEILKTESLKSNWDFVQIPNGMRRGPGGVPIPIKTPFDFVFVKVESHANLHQRHIIFSDAKCVEGKTFPASKIKPHQLNDLSKLWHKRFVAGYIVNFREIDETYFFNASQLMNIVKGKSLKPMDGLLLGTSNSINLNAIVGL